MSIFKLSKNNLGKLRSKYCRNHRNSAGKPEYLFCFKEMEVIFYESCRFFFFRNLLTAS